MTERCKYGEEQDRKTASPRFENNYLQEIDVVKPLAQRLVYSKYAINVSLHPSLHEVAGLMPTAEVIESWSQNARNW